MAARKPPTRRARRSDAASPALALPPAQTPAPRRAWSRRDGWENSLTGLGTADRDARASMVVNRPTLTWQDCEDLYRGDDMAAKIADEPAMEMTRRWLDVLVEAEEGDDSKGTKDEAEAMESALDDLDAPEVFREAAAKSRAFGGSVIVMGINDGTADPIEPVRENNIQSIEFLTVFDSLEAFPATWYTDPFHPKYGQPEVYWILPQGIGLSSSATDLNAVEHYIRNRPLKVGNGKKMVGMPEDTGVTSPLRLIHESRILRFQGVLVSRRQSRENRGWGDSVYTRVFEVLQDFGMAWGSTAALVKDFGQAVYKLVGLADMISSQDPNDQRKIQDRLAMLDASRSVLKAVVLDNGNGDASSKGDEFDRKPTPVTGLADLLDRFCNRLAAAADMPVTRLMGQSPAGLNATGQADITWWYDRIAAMQRRVLKKPAKRLIELLWLAKKGPTSGVVPDNWSIAFRPLLELSPLDEAKRRLAIAQADSLYVTGQITLPEEIAQSRFGGDEYSIETQLDKRGRDKFGAIEPEEEGPVDPTIGDIASAAHTAAKAGVEIPGVPKPTMKPLDVQIAEAKGKSGKSPSESKKPKGGTK